MSHEELADGMSLPWGTVRKRVELAVALELIQVRPSPDGQPGSNRLFIRWETVRRHQIQGALVEQGGALAEQVGAPPAHQGALVEQGGAPPAHPPNKEESVLVLRGPFKKPPPQRSSEITWEAVAGFLKAAKLAAWHAILRDAQLRGYEPNQIARMIEYFQVHCPPNTRQR